MHTTTQPVQELLEVVAEAAGEAVVVVAAAAGLVGAVVVPTIKCISQINNNKHMHTTTQPVQKLLEVVVETLEAAVEAVAAAAGIVAAAPATELVVAAAAGVGVFDPIPYSKKIKININY